MLAIGIYSTKSFAYALKAQAPLVVAALRYAGLADQPVRLYLAGDDSPEVRAGVDAYKAALKPLADARIEHLIVPVTERVGDTHNKDGNLTIAALQQAAMHAARAAGCAQFWRLESDMLPEPKTLACMRQVLDFDAPWYDIAMCTYPNTGFLGGRGNPWRWILPSVFPDERALSPKLAKAVKKRTHDEQKLRKEGKAPTAEQLEGWTALDAEIEKCPPAGNVYALQQKRWRQRGWLDHAYPAIGRGAILPTDWVGTGCTLLSRRALDLANFVGYDGGGTQDLWLCWRCWQPAGLRLAVITHALASHVKRQRLTVKTAEGEEEREKLVIHYARHELGGEFDGHLRVESKDWCGM